MGVCSATHESEKAISIWTRMKAKGFRLNSAHYGSLIKALAAREDYAQEALDLYRKMLETNIQPNEEVMTYSLRAAGQIGDVKMAFEILGQLTTLGYKTSHLHVSSILDTYSTAMKAFFVPESVVKLYLKDAWDVVNKALESGNTELVSQLVLNSLLKVNINGLKLKDAEELVLPMFGALNLDFTAKTYEVVVSKILCIFIGVMFRFGVKYLYIHVLF